MEIYSKSLFFFHTCATCYELPSDKSTMNKTASPNFSNDYRDGPDIKLAEYPAKPSICISCPAGYLIVPILDGNSEYVAYR